MFVVVLPLTTTRRTLSLHVQVEASTTTGLDETSYVQCELICSVNHDRLVHRLGVIDADVAGHVSAIVETLLNH